tara:strand:+ start:513 stop:932 length:420 start_codon:yes stop_codon:yes gene_type:complete
MPPKPHKLSKKNAKVEKIPSGEETVRSFFSLEGASLAIQANEWDVQEEMSQLIRHSRDADPKVSLRAMAQLRGILKEVALANGLIGQQKVEMTKEEEGRKVVMTGVTNRLVDNLKEIPDVLTDNEKPEFAARYLPARET